MQKVFKIPTGMPDVVRLTAEDIDDIMVTALEGGITYWCGYAEVVGNYLGEYPSEQISRGGKLVLYAEESPKRWELTLEKFLDGVAQYITSGGGDCIVFRHIDPAKIDADGADSIIQYALFGRLVFG